MWTLKMAIARLRRATGLGLVGLALGLGTLASPAAAQDGRYELQIPAGKSEVLELPTAFTDIMVANPEIADVVPLSTRSIYVVGKKMGSTVVSVYGANRQLLTAVNVVVSADVSSLKTRLHEIMPSETGIVVTAANESVVLAGRISSAPKLEQALALAESYAPGKVVNMMSVQGVQQVMLSVRFVEMERTTAKDLRINVESPDISLNKPFLSTGDALTGLDSFGVFQTILRDGNLNLNILFDALETRGLVKTLAEPTLVAMSGDTATFLAGGEFPVPVASSDEDDIRRITVEFKQFGVSLAFTPTVLDDGVINLQVAPEVSSIDPNNSVSSGGLVIPGLKVRRANTTVELRDGESFTIAGLLRDDYRNQVRQFPFIGDIPVIGALFRSTGYLKNQTELVVIVTPHLAAPTRGPQATPVDRFVPPSDFELFVAGVHQTSASYKSAEERALMSVDPTKGGLEGGYGHVLH